MSSLRKQRGERHLQLLCMAIALLIMLVGTAYPPIMMSVTGKVDHRFATMLFFAMSIGFVRGVGFIPTSNLLRWLFSGWACLLTFTTAVLIKIYF